MVEFPQRCCRD